MQHDDLNITIDPNFAGKQLVIGSPQDFDQVRKDQRTETKRHRTLNTIEDLAAYCLRWGTQVQTVIYCSQETITAVLDEAVPLQTVTFKTVWSAAFEQWKKALAHPHDQKSFKEFIERRVGDIADGINLLNVVSDMKMTTVIEHSGQFDNDQNYSVIFKESNGESAVKIPKFFDVEIPLVEGDRRRYTLKVELKLKTPKSADEKLQFVLKCWELDEILTEAMNDRIGDLKDKLDGWQIHAGQAA